MNIGSQHRLSYGCRRLTSFLLRDPRSQPLLFLYPYWFRREWRRKQHIAHALGQGEESSEVNDAPKNSKEDVKFKITRYEPKTIFQSSATLMRKDKKRAARQPYAQQNFDTLSVLDPQITPTLSSEANLEHADEEVISEVVTPSNRVRAASYADAKSDKLIRYLYKKARHDPAGLNATVIADALLWASGNVFEVNESEVESLEVSKSVLMELTGSIKSNMWIHGDGSACSITVTEKDDITSQYQTVILKGSPRSREIARKYLEQSESTSIRTSSNSSERQWGRIFRVGHLNQVPEPENWNVRTFYEYIKIITSFWPRRSVGRYVYRDSSYNQEAGKLLTTLFSRAELRHCISTKALERTLRFCRKNPDLSSVATYVLNKAISLGLQPDLATYNQEIGRLLQLNNQDMFFQRIRKMADAGFRPDARTWSLVLSYIESGSVRRRILDEVRAQGLLEKPDEYAVVATSFTKKEFPFYMTKPNGVEAFFKEMDDLFDERWLNGQTIRAMLWCCRRLGGQPVAASQVLTKSQESVRKAKLDALCMIELLHISSKTGNMRDALEILKSAPFRHRRGHDQGIIRIVQDLARKKRNYNISRLLWHYAASAGILTYGITARVKKSLVSNVLQVNENNSSGVWNRTSGKAIIGTDLDNADFDKIFPFLHKLEINNATIDWFKQYTPNDGTRNDQMMLAHLMIERDLNAWRFFRRMSWERFLTLFDQALALDLAWKEQKVIEERTIDWMVDNALKITLVPRTKPLTLDLDNIRKWFEVNGHQLDMNTLRVGEDHEQEAKPAALGIDGVKDEREAEVYSEKYPKPDNYLHLAELAQVAAVLPPVKRRRRSFAR